MQDVRLISVSVSRYSNDPTQPFTGSATFSSTLGKVELKLDGELSRRVVNALAEELVASTQQVAQALVESVSATPLIEVSETSED